MPKLLVGLGNPEKSYAANRHNIGFMAVDALADALKASEFTKKFSGHMAEASVAGEKVFLFKPQTYMNRSGVPTAELKNFYKIEIDDIIVIYDELDLPLGKIRIKQAGGSGGHNGIKSLDQHIGTNYWRVRLGIGHPGNKDMVSSYVLSDFAKEEHSSVQELLQALAKLAPKLLSKDMNGVMNDAALAMASGD